MRERHVRLRVDLARFSSVGLTGQLGSSLESIGSQTGVGTSIVVVAVAVGSSSSGIGSGGVVHCSSGVCCSRGCVGGVRVALALLLLVLDGSGGGSSSGGRIFAFTLAFHCGSGGGFR